VRKREGGGEKEEPLEGRSNHLLLTSPLINNLKRFLEKKKGGKRGDFCHDMKGDDRTVAIFFYFADSYSYSPPVISYSEKWRRRGEGKERGKRAKGKKKGGRGKPGSIGTSVKWLAEQNSLQEVDRKGEGKRKVFGGKSEKRSLSSVCHLSSITGR